MIEKDIVIIGAGPAGLYASYYAGFRGFSVAIVDALPEIGGQVTAMYPEKNIFDIAGFPAVKGRELIDGLWQQAKPGAPHLLLGERAQELAVQSEYLDVTCESGTHVRAKACIITAGIGAFSPRPLPVGMEWLNRGLVHFVPQLSVHADKDIVIVGGGDSAFDWAFSLQPIAKSVTLVHRREEFRAHHGTVEAVKALGVRLVTSAEVVAIHGEETVQSIEIQSKADGQREVLPAQTVVAALGFIANIGPIADWGIEIEKRHIVVSTSMQTSLPRVFAAGDITTYAGKVPLIAVGFGEAATAVNNAAPFIDSTFGVFPGHSSGGGSD